MSVQPLRQAPDNDFDPVRATREMLQAGNGLKKAIRECDESGIEVVKARRAFDRAFNRELVKAQGSSEAIRKANASIATEELKYLLEEAEEKRDAAKRHIAAWREIGGWWQSAAAAYRELARYDRTGPN